MQELRRTKQVFDAADVNGGGDLDEDEFTAALMGVLDYQGTDEESFLRQLFVRIDADANGTVDWHEFSNYMLLDCDSKTR